MTEQTNYAQLPEAKKEKIIKGKAILEKPKMSKRIIDYLISDKLDSVGNYLTYYILGPGVKKLLFELGQNALQMVLFNGQGGSQMPMMGGGWSNGWNNGYSIGRRDPMPYNMMGGQAYGYAQPQQPVVVNQRLGLTDISFDSRDDAYLVLDRMNKDIGHYGKVTVADFYTYSGITGQESNWTLRANGWYDLNQAHPMMTMNGRWIIDFPPPVQLR